MDIKVPEGWNKIDVEDVPQIEKAFQRSSDGLVLSVERGTTHDHDYAAAFLPENFRQDNQVIRSYEGNGYLHESDHIEDVELEVQNWMKHHKE